jgi:uncharacterized protein
VKHELVDILSCPVCKGTLELTVTTESDGDIQSGNLRCPACAVDYPITDSIPNLLPPESKV